MKAFLYLLCGLAGGVAGAAIFGALQSDPPPRAPADPRTTPGTDYAPADAVARLVREAAEHRQAVARLQRQVDELTAALGQGQPGAGTDDAAARGPRRRPGAPPADAEGPGSEASVDAIVRALVGRRFGYNESGRLIGWLTAHPEEVPQVIAALQREIEADPNNPDLRVALATAFVGEVLSIPDGPLRGAAWMKAQSAYDKAIELEPAHWQARFGKAFGVSMAPEFLGLRPEAIKQFEQVRTLQEQQAPEPHHEQTYFRLGTLYKDAGNAEKAQEIWNEGLRRFPQSELLKGTLEVSTKR